MPSVTDITFILTSACACPKIKNPWTVAQAPAIFIIEPVTTMDTSYDIFCKLPAGEILWVETAGSLEQARERVAELVANAPGDYTIFNPRSAEFVEPLAKSAKAGHGSSGTNL